MTSGLVKLCEAIYAAASFEKLVALNCSPRSTPNFSFKSSAETVSSFTSGFSTFSGADSNYYSSSS